MESYSIKKASAITAVSKYSQVIVQLVVNIVLARLLSPEAYGTLAIVSVFVALFGILSDMGFSAAVIQDKTLTKEDADNVFSFTAYVGLILSLVFAGLLYGIAYIYGNQVFISLIPIFSICVFLNTASMVPKALLLKNKHFVSVGARTVVAAVVSGLLAVICALQNLGVLALAIQSLSNALIFFLWNSISAKCRFRFRVRSSSLRKVLNYSSYQFGFSLLNFLARNLDNLLIGKVFGEVALGNYSKAYQLMMFPANNLTSVMTPSLQPILSDFQDKPDIIYKRYINVLRFLGLVASFVGPFCTLVSQEAILIMYGAGWMDAVPIFWALSFSVSAQIVYAAFPSSLQSLGNTKLLFKAGVMNAVIIVAGMIPGLYLGELYCVAIGVSVAYNICTFLSYFLVIKLGFKRSFLEFLRDLKSCFVITPCLMLVSVLWPFSIDNVFVSVILKLVSFSGIYLILLLLTKELSVFLDVLLKK